jgi:hypothetical protein
LVDEQAEQLFDREPVQEIIREANELANRQSAPIRSQPEALEFLIRPQAQRNSKYHAYLSKNLPLTNLAKEDISLVMLFEEVINLSIYMEQQKWVTEDLAQEVAATFDTWLSGKRAVDMATFKAIAEQTYTLRRIDEQKPTATGRFKV